MNDVLFQVFVSSTFIDLETERLAVLRAIASTGNIPTGMEYFPATHQPPWEYIRQMIDLSDFYVLIIGSRYGSLTPEGISFTEKEYDYAIASEKLVYAFIHANPGNIPSKFSDRDPAALERLSAFRTKVEGRHGRMTWDSPETLATNVLASLYVATRHPTAKGWVRAGKVDTQQATELRRLQDENRELKEQLFSRPHDESPTTIPEAYRVASILPKVLRDVLITIAEHRHAPLKWTSSNSDALRYFESEDMIEDAHDAGYWPTRKGWEVVDACRKIRVLDALVTFGPNVAESISAIAQLRPEDVDATIRNLAPWFVTVASKNETGQVTWQATLRGRWLLNQARL